MLGQKAHAACRRDEKTNDDPNRCFLSANGKSYQRVKAAIKWLIICLFKIMHCLRLRQEFHAKIGSERHRKTHEASNGRQALGELARVCPDLVLCDISMPELDGYGVLDALQERGLTMPKFLLSSSPPLPIQGTSLMASVLAQMITSLSQSIMISYWRPSKRVCGRSDASVRRAHCGRLNPTLQN